MIIAPAKDGGPSLLLIEGGLTAIAIALSFAMPNAGSSRFRRIELAFRRLAFKKPLAVATVGATALLLRLALLPLCPVPLPFIQDDFSFLLAADTFAAGRLTNPTPAMWMHFESFHITMQPTYMSMYFPAQGLLLAGGKVLFGQPWFGVLCMSSLMCAAICWMLQAWLPPGWALLGGLLAILRLSLFSYWSNTYTGGATISAVGGALVLGAFPRFMKRPRFMEALLMAIGIILLATCRPYEGILLCVPVAFVLGRWMLVARNRPSKSTLLRAAGVPVLLVLAAGFWMGFYNYRVFGNPLTPPYKVNRATYAIAPYYVWQSQRPEPLYRHAVMRKFYRENELEAFAKIHTRFGFERQFAKDLLTSTLFFSGLALLPPLIMVRRAVMDRRLRFLVISVCVLVAGMAIEIFLIPHYLAPFTAAFYALGLQAFRHLRVWTPGGKPVGLALVRMLVTLCLALAGVRALASPLHLRIAEWPPSQWSSEWYGPLRFGTARADIETKLERAPGRQLVLVRYMPEHNVLDEWVYNPADIDNAKVIWAREMDTAQNLELVRYYRDRKVWLVQPDSPSTYLSPYPLGNAVEAGSR